MEKLLKILGLFLLPAFVLTSCSNDPESAGEDAGELFCECWELQDEYNDLEKDLDKLDWDKEDEREEIADIKSQMFDLDVEMKELVHEMSEIELAQWDEQEKKKDKDKWVADYMSALAEYVDNNCDKFENFEKGDLVVEDIDELKQLAKWANEILENK